MTKDTSHPIADLEGKVALVTGGGAGIGRAIVAQFARCGATVFAADIDSDSLADVERQARDQKWNVHSVNCEVRVTAEVDALMRVVLEHEQELRVFAGL